MNKLLLGIMLSGVIAFSAVSPVNAGGDTDQEVGKETQGQVTVSPETKDAVKKDGKKYKVTTSWYYWLTSDDHLGDACNIQ